jgi:putative membrane protein
MHLILKLLVGSFAVFLTAYILPGVKVANFITALVAAVVLAAINAFIKPLLIILTLPLNILTLGLLTFVINALLVLLAAAIVPGFTVKSFWWALLFGLILAIVTYVLNSFSK